MKLNCDFQNRKKALLRLLLMQYKFSQIWQPYTFVLDTGQTYEKIMHTSISLYYYMIYCVKVPQCRYDAFLQSCFFAESLQWDFSLLKDVEVPVLYFPAPQKQCRHHVREEQQSRSPVLLTHLYTRTELSPNQVLQLLHD